MSLSSWYAGLAASQPDLFRLIVDFNGRPQHWAHPERLAPVPFPAVLEYLSTSPAGLPHASRYTSRQLGLDRVSPWWDFTLPRRRLVLLSWNTLDTLASYCGAALHAAKIAMTIARDQTAELKGAIGAAAHAFALRRGKLIPLPAAYQAGPLLPAHPLGIQIKASGWAMILTMLSPEPPEILRRFNVKLPPEANLEGSSAEKAPDDHCEQIWMFLRRIGAEVFSPEELKCFA